MARSNNIPSHWQLKKLGEVCHTTSGGTPSRQKASYYNGDIPWVKSGELDRGLILDTEEKISEDAIKNSSAKVFPKGTLLIALYGATIGKLAFLGVDAATNQAICGIFKNANIDSNYLYHFLFYKKPNLVKQGIGGAQPNISQGILKNLDLPIPPLPEQQAIVTKIEELLSKLENGKQQLQTAQQQLKVYRQSLLKWACEGKLTNKNVKNGVLPKGWKIEKLGVVCEIKNGKNQKLVVNPNGKFPIYGSAGKMGYADSYICEAGSTIVGRKGTINKPLYVNEKFWNVDTAFGFMPNTDLIINRFLYFFCLSFNFAKLDKSTTIPSLAKTDLQKIDVVVPPLKEQQLIVSELESKLTVCDKIEETISQSLQQAETLKQSILKKAFEGKLVTAIAEQREAKVIPLYKLDFK
ncbi:MAG: Type-1 restriction enzyme EcoKI specificity protein [Saprospiraceae bacterium]|nr:Type-1 restriction enzyme EcoKI specificity protein [Saprospiraceae bacterium]